MGKGYHVIKLEVGEELEKGGREVDVKCHGM